MKIKLNNTSHPQLIGVFTSFLIIWQIHKLFVVDDCLEKGGVFEYKSGICFLSNDEQYLSSLPDIVLGAYFIIGLVGSFFIAKLIRKFLMNKNQ